MLHPLVVTVFLLVASTFAQTLQKRTLQRSSDDEYRNTRSGNKSPSPQQTRDLNIRFPAKLGIEVWTTGNEQQSGTSHQETSKKHRRKSQRKQHEENFLRRHSSNLESNLGSDSENEVTARKTSRRRLRSDLEDDDVFEAVRGGLSDMERLLPSEENAGHSAGEGVSQRHPDQYIDIIESTHIESKESKKKSALKKLKEKLKLNDGFPQVEFGFGKKKKYKEYLESEFEDKPKKKGFAKKAKEWLGFGNKKHRTEEMIDQQIRQEWEERNGIQESGFEDKPKKKGFMKKVKGWLGFGNKKHRTGEVLDHQISEQWEEYFKQRSASHDGHRSRKNSVSGESSKFRVQETFKTTEVLDEDLTDGQGKYSRKNSASGDERRKSRKASVSAESGISGISRSQEKVPTTGGIHDQSLTDEQRRYFESIYNLDGNRKESKTDTLKPENVSQKERKSSHVGKYPKKSKKHHIKYLESSSSSGLSSSSDSDSDLDSSSSSSSDSDFDSDLNYKPKKYKKKSFVTEIDTTLLKKKSSHKKSKKQHIGQYLDSSSSSSSSSDSDSDPGFNIVVNYKPKKYKKKGFVTEINTTLLKKKSSHKKSKKHHSKYLESSSDSSSDSDSDFDSSSDSDSDFDSDLNYKPKKYKKKSFVTEIDTTLLKKKSHKKSKKHHSKYSSSSSGLSSDSDSSSDFDRKGYIKYKKFKNPGFQEFETVVQQEKISSPYPRKSHKKSSKQSYREHFDLNPELSPEFNLGFNPELDPYLNFDHRIHGHKSKNSFKKLGRKLIEFGDNSPEIGARIGHKIGKAVSKAIGSTVRAKHSVSRSMSKLKYELQHFDRKIEYVVVKGIRKAAKLIRNFPRRVGRLLKKLFNLPQKLFSGILNIRSKLDELRRNMRDTYRYAKLMAELDYMILDVSRSAREQSRHILTEASELGLLNKTKVAVINTTVAFMLITLS
ncbi:hypothetical protein BDV3_002991 [Batrachochytrium dendrobatidis]